MPPLLHQPPDQAQPVVLVVDRELAGEAEQLGLAAEQPRGERVERADPQAGRVAVEQPADPLLHLARGLVGEGHGEDPVGRHAVPVDQARDAGGEHARLPRARAREHEQRAVDVLHRLPLRRVERVAPARAPEVSIMWRAPPAECESRNRLPSRSAPAPARRRGRPRRRGATSARPMPQPPRLVVMPGSNRVRRISRGMPGPSSITRISPIPCSRRRLAG